MRWFVGAKLAEELILGLDFGTSSVKGIFIDFKGTILKRVESKIPLLFGYVRFIDVLLALAADTMNSYCLDEEVNFQPPRYFLYYYMKILNINNK
jgi:hypothetical protein